MEHDLSLPFDLSGEEKMCSQHSQTRLTGVRVRMGGSTGNIRGQRYYQRV